MKKRDLRSVRRPRSSKPDYPTLEEFDVNRRAFLARLGGLLGASALAGLASACGGRPVGADEPVGSDAGVPMGGVADAMPPPGDMSGTASDMPPRLDAGMGGVADSMPPPGDPDLGMGGVATDMAAPLDASLGVADAMPPKLDVSAADVRPDLGGPAGAPPAPDSEADGGGSCPTP